MNNGVDLHIKRPGMRSGIIGVAALVIGAALAVILIGGLTKSGFSILDDHGLLNFLGSDNSLHARDIWHALMSTEVGEFGKSQRFRPVYFSQLVMEAALFGNRPLGYHIVQIVGFAAFLWAVAWGSMRALGIFGGAAFLLLIVAPKFWGDVWTYSFVPEQTVVIGAAIAIFGFGKSIEGLTKASDAKLGMWIILAGVGTVLSMGGKENFMFLGFPYVLIFAAALWRELISRRDTLAGLLLLAIMLIICFGIVYPNAGKPTDFYGEDNSISHRIGILFHSEQITVIVSAAILGIVGIFVGLKRPLDRKTVAVGSLLFVEALYFAWEVFFYNGRIPLGNRYDFPSILFYPLMFATAVVLIGSIAQRFGMTASLVRMAVQAVVVVGAGAWAIQNVEFPLPVTTAVARSNVRTGMMMDDLKESRRLTSAHPDWPVIVNADMPWDYEAVLTLPIWFRKLDISNPLVSSVRISPENQKSDFEKTLAGQMVGWSDGTMPERFNMSLAQARTMIDAGQCFEVSFRTPITGCTKLPFNPTKYLPS